MLAKLGCFLFKNSRYLTFNKEKLFQVTMLKATLFLGNYLKKISIEYVL